jgi:germacradienol/geosmin synthase
MLLELRELAPALPWKRNREFDRVLRHSTRWLQSMQASYDAEVSATATAYAFPAASGDVLDLASDWITWMFYWDDYFKVNFTDSGDIAGARRCIRQLTALFGGGVPVDALQCMLSDLLARTASAAERNRDLVAQMRLDMREYIEIPLRELVNVVEGRVPGLLDFAATRRGSFGSQFLARLVHFAASPDLPMTVAGHPFVRSMECAFGDTVLLENDIASYRLEASNGDLGDNVIVVLEKFLACDERTALDYAKELLCRRLEEFMWTQKQLREEPPEGLEPSGFDAYLQGVEDFVAGHRKFCVETLRYRVAAQGPGQTSSTADVETAADATMIQGTRQ